MRRMINFQKLKKHPWYSRLLSKLSKKEVDFCEETIKETSHLSDDDFCQMAQRFGHTESERQYKNHRLINELLLASGAK